LGLVSATILALVFLASCQKSAQHSPAPVTKTEPATVITATPVQPAPIPASRPPASTGPSPAVNPPAAAPSPADPGLHLTKEGTDKAEPAGSRSFTSPAGLMALGRESRFLPEDFKIGPLGDARGSDLRGDKAMTTAEHFLSHLVGGTIETKDISPDAQASLSDTISYGLKRGYQPIAYRLGAIKTDANGQMSATLRLWGTVGTSEGEIYFTRVGEEWLVSDLQLSLAQMAVAKTAPKEKFFPSAYRWLLED